MSRDGRGRRLPEPVRAWIDARPEAPPALARRVEEALARAAPDDVSPERLPELLAEAGLDRLRAALELSRAAADERLLGEERPPARAAALDLLAADALLTYACEAAADLGPEALEALAARYGAVRMAALIEGPSATPGPPSGGTAAPPDSGSRGRHAK